MSQTTNNKKVTEPYVIGQDDVNKRDQAKKGEDKRQTRKKKSPTKEHRVTDREMKSRSVWGQREGRRAGREEKADYSHGWCCAQSNQYNPLLSISVSCSLLRNMTLHKDHKTSNTDQHCRHIQVCHTNTGKSKKKRSNRHEHSLKTHLAPKNSTNSLELKNLCFVVCLEKIGPC